MIQILKNYEKQGLLFSQKHLNLPLSIWNYSDKVQYEDLWDDITLMCRGLVVDEETDKIVARPFKKFFNIEQNKYTPTQNFEVFEKLDGSLGIVFWYKNDWIFASRGSFNSEQVVKGKEMFDIKDKNCLFKQLTYIFEIIYPQNRIVVDYNGVKDLFLLGAINTESGEEVDYRNLEFNNHFLHYIPAKKYDGIKDYQALKQIINNNQEGFVIRFSNGDRVKIKGEEYLRLHRIMTAVSTTSIWGCLKDGEDLMELLKDVPDEFYNVVDAYKNFLLGEFETINQHIQCAYNQRIKDLGEVSDRDFALHIKDNVFKSFFFYLRKNKDITESIWKKLKPEYRRL